MRGMQGKGVRGRGRGVFEGLKFAGIYSAILKIPGLDVFELVRSGLGVPIPRELCWGKFCNDERICCRARIKHASVEAWCRSTRKLSSAKTYLATKRICRFLYH